jgi:hypothetical protein
VPIDGATERRLKGANFLCVEARLLDGFKDNGVHQSLLSPFFCFCVIFFAIALEVFDRKGWIANYREVSESEAGPGSVARGRFISASRSQRTYPIDQRKRIMPIEVK